MVNVTKTKKLSNVRSAGADDKARIVPAIKFSLEEALEYIQRDEYVEVTPKYLRLRKIHLKEVEYKSMMMYSYQMKKSIGVFHQIDLKISLVNFRKLCNKISILSRLSLKKMKKYKETRCGGSHL